jgi:heat shock protein HslJ
MVKISLMLALALSACTAVSSPAATAGPEVRPVVAHDRLAGRWAVAVVGGRPARGAWIEFGGEGLAKITTVGNAIYVASPQPPTRAFLGCNDWYLSGWTRNGDKLTLGVEMSHRTERGCDPVAEALEETAYGILSLPLTMELTPPGHLRLINERGTVDLVR